MDSDKTSIEMKRVSYINIFSIFGILVGVVFGLINLQGEEVANGLVEIFFAAVLLFNLILLRIHKNINLAVNVVTMILFLPLLTLLMTGGIEGTGIYWTFLLPITLYLLHESFTATAWIILYISIVILMTALSLSGILTVHYTNTEIRQLLISLIVETAMLFVNQATIEKVRKIMVFRSRELVKAMKKLRDEAEAKERLQEEAEEYSSQIKKQNQNLERTKVAMSNLLEDLNDEKERIKELSIKDEALLKSIGEGMLATDAYGRIEKVNLRLLEMLYLKEADLVGIGLFKAIKAYDEKGKEIPPLERAEGEAIATGASTSAIYTIKRANGTEFSAGVNAAPYIVDNKPIGAVVTIRDVTKEVEVDKAKTEFVSLASHQLRTPLTAINWYLEMLSGGDVGKLKKEQAEYVDEIYKANQRMVALVNSLLNVSRIDLGTFLIDPKPTNLKSVADTVIKELEGQIKTKKQTLKTEYGEEVKEIIADQKLMYIVFQNLISNSVKYTPEKGKIWVRIRKEAKNTIIEVEDNGYGIPKEQHSKIFSKLFRADNVVAKDTDGTGLGLYVLKSIIEDSGGKVWFESEQDKGTKFVVELPENGMEKREGTKGLSTT